MTDRERSQDTTEEEEEEASRQELGTLNQDPEGGDTNPAPDNDPPIISSGG